VFRSRLARATRVIKANGIVQICRIGTTLSKIVSPRFSKIRSILTVIRAATQAPALKDLALAPGLRFFCIPGSFHPCPSTASVREFPTSRSRISPKKPGRIS
jgi:hypothetical protein